LRPSSHRAELGALALIATLHCRAWVRSVHCGSRTESNLRTSLIRLTWGKPLAQLDCGN